MYYIRKENGNLFFSLLGNKLTGSVFLLDDVEEVPLLLVVVGIQLG
jgi:hypothetical protein